MFFIRALKLGLRIFLYVQKARSLYLSGSIWHIDLIYFIGLDVTIGILYFLLDTGPLAVELSKVGLLSFQNQFGTGLSIL